MVWSVAEMAVLTRKVCVVTGANSGLGLEASRQLCARGARVIMCARDPDAANAALREVAAAGAAGGLGGAAELVKLDLASLASVRAFAQAFEAKALPCHVLMNNAGVMMTPFGRTADGIEQQLGHVGHFLLTKLLLPALLRSAPSRIVNLSSSLHTACPAGGIRADLDWADGREYDPTAAYGQSKWANVVFTRELARRLHGKPVFVNANHPGFVDTRLTRHRENSWLIKMVVPLYKRAMGALPVEQGALTQLFLAADPSIERDNIRGAFYYPIALPFEPVVPQGTTMEAEQAKLWALSERLVGETFL